MPRRHHKKEKCVNEKDTTKPDVLGSPGQKIWFY